MCEFEVLFSSTKTQYGIDSCCFAWACKNFATCFNEALVFCAMEKKKKLFLNHNLAQQLLLFRSVGGELWFVMHLI